MSWFGSIFHYLTIKMLYNRCTGIYKFGNNTYPRRIRRRSNLGHIFQGKKCVIWARKYSRLCWDLKVVGYDLLFVFLLMVCWCAPGIKDWFLAVATDLSLSQSIQTVGPICLFCGSQRLFSLGVQWLGNEADHSSPSGAIVIPPHPHMPLWHAQWQLYP
jgi:hypothetical protein